MHPLFNLVAGLAVGVIGVRLAKSANTQKALQRTASTGGKTMHTGFSRARSGVRGLAVSSLKTVEKTSAGLRQTLDPEPSDKNSATQASDDLAREADSPDRNPSTQASEDLPREAEPRDGKVVS